MRCGGGGCARPSPQRGFEHTGLTAATPGRAYRDMLRKQLEIRFAQISETAVSIIKEERAAREQKTTRLRTLRLANEEQSHYRGQQPAKR